MELRKIIMGTRFYGYALCDKTRIVFFHKNGAFMCEGESLQSACQKLAQWAVGQLQSWNLPTCKELRDQAKGKNGQPFIWLENM